MPERLGEHRQHQRQGQREGQQQLPALTSQALCLGLGDGALVVVQAGRVTGGLDRGDQRGGFEWPH